MSDGQSESVVDCRCSDQYAITVALNFESHSIGRQNAKQVNFKFEDNGLKYRFYHKLSLLFCPPCLANQACRPAKTHGSS